MANRDAAEYKEAQQKAKAGEGIDEIPALMRQYLQEHWNGRVPTRESFLPEMTKLSCVVLAELVREGKLDVLIGRLAQVGDEKRLATHCIAEVMAAKNALLMAQCCDVTFELGLQGGRTQQDIGEEHHLGKASVSAICTTLKETFTGKPGTGMKSNDAVQKYSNIRKGRRAKPMPAVWEFADTLLRAFSRHERREHYTKRDR